MIVTHANNLNTCYSVIPVTRNKSYKLKLTVNGAFHIRFSVKDPDNDTHLEWITNTIYGEDGNYTYVVTPKTNGVLSICKSKDRLNCWTALTVNVEEASDETNI